MIQLQQQAEGLEKKLQTRKAIEQRIREIKIKINRDNYSEAIEIAKATLVTLGPSTAVTQLLNSAQVEFESREKKRKQEKDLEEIRGLVEAGKLDEATNMLNVALSTNKLDGIDPRVRRVADDLDAAKTRLSSPLPSGPDEPPPFSKEYAYQVRPPEPHPIDDNPLTLTLVPSPSPSNPPVAFQSASPSAPPVPEPHKVPEVVQPVSFAAPPAEVSPPALPAEKHAAEEPAVRKAEVTPAGPLVRRAEVVRQSEPVKPPVAPKVESVNPPVPPSRKAKAANPPAPPVPPAVVIEQAEPPVQKQARPEVVPTPTPVVLPLWKRPALVAGGVVVLLVLAWAGIHAFSGSRKPGSTLAVHVPQQLAAPKPQVNPVEERQRNAINAADKDRAAGNLQSAAGELEQAAALNGPLNAELQKKQDQIREEMNNKTLAELGRRQEQLWLQAQKEIGRSQFNSAEQDLRKIVAEKDGPRETMTRRITSTKSYPSAKKKNDAL